MEQELQSPIQVSKDGSAIELIQQDQKIPENDVPREQGNLLQRGPCYEFIIGKQATVRNFDLFLCEVIRQNDPVLFEKTMHKWPEANMCKTALQSPLNIAIQYRRYRMIEILISNGALPHLPGLIKYETDEDFISPVELALKIDDIGTLKRLTQSNQYLIPRSDELTEVAIKHPLYLAYKYLADRCLLFLHIKALDNLQLSRGEDFAGSLSLSETENNIGYILKNNKNIIHISQQCVDNIIVGYESISRTRGDHALYKIIEEIRALVHQKYHEKLYADMFFPVVQNMIQIMLWKGMIHSPPTHPQRNCLDSMGSLMIHLTRASPEVTYHIYNIIIMLVSVGYTFTNITRVSELIQVSYSQFKDLTYLDVYLSFVSHEERTKIISDCCGVKAIRNSIMKDLVLSKIYEVQSLVEIAVNTVRKCLSGQHFLNNLMELNLCNGHLILLSPFLKQDIKEIYFMMEYVIQCSRDVEYTVE